MPALPDLEPFTIPDLEELQGRIAERIVVLRKQTAAELRERFAKEAEQAGLSMDEVLGKSAGKKKSSSKGNSAPAKYRNPAEPNQTWTGIGRQPKWVIEFLQDDSHSLADLEIRKSVHEAA